MPRKDRADRIAIGRSFEDVIDAMMTTIRKEAIFTTGELVRFYRIAHSLGTSGDKLAAILESGIGRASRKKDRAKQRRASMPSPRSDPSRC